ncbi:MAG: hypothetical protein IJV39_00590 [Ruminococcus sp.]|nr:hypothetical protein [Ruminococcus sp.]
MKKCDYCGTEISYHDIYCGEECQDKAAKFYNLRDEYEKLFTFLDAVFVFMIPIGLFIGMFAGNLGDILIVSGLIGLGIMLLILPFPTESMIKKYKIKKAKKLCRYFALILIAVGIIGAVIFSFAT